MCGRFTQYRTAIEYLEALRYDKPIESGIDPEPIGRYNVPPRSRVLVFFETASGLRMAKLPWGYQPWWAKGKRPPAINARVETAATSKFFRDVWRNDLAREWMEPGLSLERAEELVRDLALPVEAFEWYPVDRAVGNVKSEGAHLIEQIDDPSL